MGKGCVPSAENPRTRYLKGLRKDRGSRMRRAVPSIPRLSAISLKCSPISPGIISVCAACASRSRARFAQRLPAAPPVHDRRRARPSRGPASRSRQPRIRSPVAASAMRREVHPGVRSWMPVARQRIRHALMPVEAAQGAVVARRVIVMSARQSVVGDQERALLERRTDAAPIQAGSARAPLGNESLRHRLRQAATQRSDRRRTSTLRRPGAPTRQNRRPLCTTPSASQPSPVMRKRSTGSASATLHSPLRRRASAPPAARRAIRPAPPGRGEPASSCLLAAREAAGSTSTMR